MTAIEAVLDFYDVRYSSNISGEQSILCPVHEERNKSCSLNLSTEAWNCHACGKRGGVIQLIMYREGVTFEAASQRVQEIAGTCDGDVRVRNGQDRNRIRVPPGTGFAPKYRRQVPSRNRKRPSFGS